MGRGTPPKPAVHGSGSDQGELLELTPVGYPAIVTAGRAISLSLFVPASEQDGRKIEPLHRHRARVVTAQGRKPFVQTYPDKRSTAWEEYVAGVTRLQALQTEVDGEDFTLPIKDMRVMLSIRFNLPKPKSYPKRVVQHTKKPDIDNYAKALIDGLVKARILEDDGLITDLSVYKRYIAPGHPEGVELDLVALPTEVV